MDEDRSPVAATDQTVDGALASPGTTDSTA
jgi:hypothetical protein